MEAATLAPKVGRSDDRLEQVRDALLSARTGTVRSALYHFMRQNHDELSAIFEEASPAWGPLAERFGSIGLTDRGGKPPTANTARMTWWRVRGDVKRARERRDNLQPAGVVAGIRIARSTPADDAAEGNAELPAEPEFRLATPITPIVPFASTPATARPAPVEQRRDPDAAIAELLARPRAGAIPMPDVPEPEDE